MSREPTKRVEMSRQAAEERIRNFAEVALGLSPESAVAEAARCLQCKKPRCVEGCPVNVPIPEFIRLVKDGRFQEALLKIKEKNSLPAICGRVCPQETQCEKQCVLGRKGEPVNIGALERFAADQEKANVPSDRITRSVTTSTKKVAVVGSGPAGLVVAADLALLGYQVTIYEALHEAGGVLRYGIPEFRLPKSILEKELQYVQSLGVDIQVNMVIGKTLNIDDLFAMEYAAIFIGTGAGLPYFLGVPGEELNGVYSANEFLTRVNLMKGFLFPEWDTPVWVGRSVCVIGAGNVAMDSARIAVRLGAEEVRVVYRRSFEEMPARKDELHHAQEEGVKFELLTNPAEILGKDGWVRGLKCVRMELTEPDESGRRRPIPVPGSELTIEADTVIVAIGQGPNPLLQSVTPDLSLDRYGRIVADPETGETSVRGVFAGGDIVTGAATVISAMGAGRRSALAIARYLAEQQN